MLQTCATVSCHLALQHSAVGRAAELLQSFCWRSVEGLRQQEAQAACRQTAQAEHSERHGGVESPLQHTHTNNYIKKSVCLSESSGFLSRFRNSFHIIHKGRCCSLIQSFWLDLMLYKSQISLLWLKLRLWFGCHKLLKSHKPPQGVTISSGSSYTYCSHGLTEVREFRDYCYYDLIIFHRVCCYKVNSHVKVK